MEHLIQDLLLLGLVTLPLFFLAASRKIPSALPCILGGALAAPLMSHGGHHQRELAMEFASDFFLFAVGLEFAVLALIRDWKKLTRYGALQLGLTTAVVFGLLLAFGLGWQAALTFGMLTALSSSAVVLDLFSTRNELNSEHGKAAAGILVIQDASVVLMLLVLPIIAGGELTAMTFMKPLIAGAAIGAAIIVARRFAPKLFDICQSYCLTELFLMVLVVFTLGFSMLASFVGISLAFGAFLGGLALADTNKTHDVERATRNIASICKCFFFALLGSELHWSTVLNHAPLVLGIAVLLVLGKSLIGFVAVFGKERLNEALLAGIAIAQVGEFSFLLGAQAEQLELIGGNALDIFVVSALITIAFTPIWHIIGPKLIALLPIEEETKHAFISMAASRDPNNHVVVIGYGKIGTQLARRVRSLGYDLVIVDSDTDAVTRARQHHHNDKQVTVVHGGGAIAEDLQLAEVPTARLVSITYEQEEAVRSTMDAIRRHNPNVRIQYIGHPEEPNSVELEGPNGLLFNAKDAATEAFIDDLREHHRQGFRRKASQA